MHVIDDLTFPPSKRHKFNTYEGNYTFLFHGNCIDGWFSAYIAYSAIKEKNKTGFIHMYPISPSQTNTWPTIHQMTGTNILLLDVSFPKEYRTEWLRCGALSIDCIDHHATSISHWPENCPIDIESCAALQTWHRFYPGIEVPFWLNSIDRIDRWDNPTDDDRCIREVLNVIAHKPVQKKIDEAFSMTEQFIMTTRNITGISAIIEHGRSILIPKDEELMKILNKDCIKSQPNIHIHSLTIDLIQGWNLPQTWLNLKVFIIDNTGIALDTTGASHLAFKNYDIDVFINYRKKYDKFSKKMVYTYSARSRIFDMTDGTILKGHPHAAGASLIKIKGETLPFLLYDNKWCWTK